MIISFLNDVDIQLIKELKNSFGKKISVRPKNLFLGHSVYPPKYLIDYVICS